MDHLALGDSVYSIGRSRCVYVCVCVCVCVRVCVCLFSLLLFVVIVVFLCFLFFFSFVVGFRGFLFTYCTLYRRKWRSLGGRMGRAESKFNVHYFFQRINSYSHSHTLCLLFRSQSRSCRKRWSSMTAQTQNSTRKCALCGRFVIRILVRK